MKLNLNGLFFALTFPLGFNDKLYHEGNISKMPDFDVFFSLLKFKRRKRLISKRKLVLKNV